MMIIILAIGLAVSLLCTLVFVSACVISGRTNDTPVMPGPGAFQEDGSAQPAARPAPRPTPRYAHPLH